MNARPILQLDIQIVATYFELPLIHHQPIVQDFHYMFPFHYGIMFSMQQGRFTNFVTWHMHLKKDNDGSNSNTYQNANGLMERGYYSKGRNKLFSIMQSMHFNDTIFIKIPPLKPCKLIKISFKLVFDEQKYHNFRLVVNLTSIYPRFQ